MKLLFITEFFPADHQLKFTGGVEAYNYFLIKELAKKHQVTVICRRTTSKNFNEKYRVIRIGSGHSRIDATFSTIPERFIFGLKAVLAATKEDFDIIQGNNFVTYISAYIAGFLKKRPTIAWYPDVFIGKWMELTGFSTGLIGEIIEKVSLKLPWTKVIALSNTTKNKLTLRGVKKDNIETIYAGVDRTFFKNIVVKKEKIFTICTISRLVNYKNIDVLIEAVKILRDQNKRFRVIIIGDGPDKNKIKQLVVKYNLSNVVIKSNLSRTDIGKYLKSSHIFCLPSSEEGFGLAILEAISANLPYIVSDIPVLREITQSGKGGLFFKEKDSEDLADKISRLMRNNKLRDKLNAEGQKLLRTYSWENMASQFEKQYLKLQRKPKILMSIDAWFPHVGGGQFHVLELAKELQKTGFEVVIVAHNNGDWKNNTNLEIARIGKIRRFSNIFGRLEYLFLSTIYILRSDYDILHLFAFSSGLLAPIIRVFKRKPIVFTILGEGINIAGLPLGAKFLQDLVFYKIRYDLEITVSRSIIKEKTSSEKLIFISNGVDLGKFQRYIRSRRSIKRVLCIARLFYDKGVDLLIEVFKTLPDRSLKLIVVGNGPEEKRLKAQAQGSTNIEFRDTVSGEDYPRTLKEADLMVIPSRTEGLPLRLLEAWASKLPVVATVAGDTAKYVKDSENGFLTEINEKSIREGILRALNTRNLSGVADQAYVDVQKYSWSNVAEKTAREYQRLIDEKTKN